MVSPGAQQSLQMTALPRLPRPVHNAKRVSLIGPELKLNGIGSSEDHLEIVSKGGCIICLWWPCSTDERADATHSHRKNFVEKLDNPHNDYGDDISRDGDMNPNNQLN